MSLETIAIVICTKDRQAILTDCLASVAHQTRLPDELLVVDASTEPAEAQVDSFRQAVYNRCRVRLIQASPGLTLQRNIGIDASSSSIVLFLDDDVVLEPDYVAEILAVYQDDTEHTIGGVGGAIVPDPTPVESLHYRWFARCFMLSSHGRGYVKRSGWPEYLLSPTKACDVEFLSGCNMSYRRQAIRGLHFDERLAGYALGEDLDFSYRVSRRHRLVLTPRARVDHREAGGGRPDYSRMKEMTGFNQYLFFRERVARGPIDWLFFIWAACGRILRTLQEPGEGRIVGLFRGYRLVVKHLFQKREPFDFRHPNRSQ